MDQSNPEMHISTLEYSPLIPAKEEIKLACKKEKHLGTFAIVPNKLLSFNTSVISNSKVLFQTGMISFNILTEGNIRRRKHER
jgi:hypothetical protein